MLTQDRSESETASLASSVGEILERNGPQADVTVGQGAG